MDGATGTDGHELHREYGLGASLFALVDRMKNLSEAIICLLGDENLDVDDTAALVKGGTQEK